MSWKTEYPHQYALFAASEMQHRDNYFACMDEPQPPHAVQSYLDWEDRFARLDQESRQNIIERAAPLVARRDTNEGRDWTALFDTLNEVKGYIYLQDLGYNDVRFIPRSSEKKQKTPDVRGSGSLGDALLEVKTVNISDDDISLFGTLQKGSRGIPEGLKHKLASDYATACNQLHSFPVREPARRICCFYISVDFRLTGARSNQDALNDYLASIRKDCEIYHHSGHWKSR